MSGVDQGDTKPTDPAGGGHISLKVKGQEQVHYLGLQVLSNPYPPSHYFGLFHVIDELLRLQKNFMHQECSTKSRHFFVNMN